MSLWSRIRNVIRPASYENEIREELDFHLEMDQRNGHDSREAHVRLGNSTRIEEQVREVRIVAWLESWWLDVRLGVRMLARYPGLTLAGTAGIGVAVAIAAGGYGVINDNYLAAPLPFQGGDRLVSVEMWDSAVSNHERRILRDFQAWRSDVKSIQEISAFRILRPNLIVPGVRPESVRVAAMSPSGFQAVGVQPLLGRFLKPEDEREGAPHVVVIGENVWRNRFASDPAILGRSIRFGATTHEIIGVMPKGFAFPVNDHFWIPLRAGVGSPVPLAGPDLTVFGRLASGASLESAQAELTAVVQRAAHEFPLVYAHLRPQVTPYTRAIVGVSSPDDVAGLLGMQGLAMFLLVLVCLNVAILVYTRTAMRQAEIGLRTALGASRSRIVGQLFLEALVLSFVAALAGVAIAALALRQVGMSTLSLASDLPFWISFHLSPEAILYAVALSAFAAAIVGILPALQATRPGIQIGFSVRGAGNLRLGRIWTVLIVAQVTCAVALLPPAVSGAWDELQVGLARTGFAAERYLSAELGMDSETGASGPVVSRDFTARFASRQTELIRRLLEEPDVANVTFATSIPGDEQGARMEVENSGTEALEIRFARVDVNFFRVFQVPILAGRGFEVPDAVPVGEASVVINQPLAQKLFGGNALGRRIRYVRSGPAELNTGPGRWYEVVGIVSDFPVGASPGMRDSAFKVYHAVGVGVLNPAALAIQMRGGAPAAFSQRLQEIGEQVDPDIHLRKIRSLDEALHSEQWISRMTAAVFLAITISVLLLSSAGIYALMSFTVSQRWKEIGIRMALGAEWKQIVASIFSRALLQLALGAALGLALGIAIEKASGGAIMGSNAKIVLPAVTLVVVGVGFLAALGPTRRSLRIQPTEALMEE